ncbi:WAS/WASL-interacting protein family member 3-like isoform X3 [Mustela erminea]|uniref:WAS/WASL-interacting protein family member 3-like isoform X3 n=1 Tax=Mustela erminea TaxID=36723 RepID=UPI001386611C|nr:WAS/WASL-interacting protein family member 3-like isoform X3 [Mustela erminea]
MPPPTLPPPRDAGVPGSPPPPGRPATAAAPAARPLQSEGRKARVTVETGDPGRCGRAPAAGRGPGQSWKTVSRRRSDRGRVPRGTAALSELRADLRCRRGSAGARATPASNRTCAPQGGGRGRGRGRPGAGLGVRRLGFWSWPCAPLSGPTQRKETEVRWHLELEMKGRRPSPESPSNSSPSLSLFPALSLREDPVRNGEAQSQAD